MLVLGSSRSTVILAGSMSSFADMNSQVKIAYKQKSIFRFWLKKTDCFTLDYYSFSGSVYLKAICIVLLLPWRRLRKGQHDPFGLIVSQSGLSLLLLDELVDGSACVALFAFKERREDLCSFGCGPSCIRHTHSRSSRWMLGAHAYCLDKGSRKLLA